MKETKPIFPEDVEVIRDPVMTGFILAGGKLYRSEAEKAARWGAATHVHCECGGAAEKGWIKCGVCRSKSATERYLAMPEVEWDGKTPIALNDGEEYFFDPDDLVMYLEDLEDDSVSPEDLQLVLCEPTKFKKLEWDYFSGDTLEDWEPESELKALVNQLNAYLEKASTNTWVPGNQRVTLTWDDLGGCPWEVRL